jgi:hypothetical protein
VKYAWLTGLWLATLVGAAPAWSADDPGLENLALCRASWLDWKTADPARLESFKAFVRSGFSHKDNDAFFAPKSPMAVAGLKVTQVFPESVGMGVGFSVLVDATFDVARKALEQALGRPLGQCGASDGMRACELPIAAQRTVTLMSGDQPSDKTALIGCYYLYEP